MAEQDATEQGVTEPLEATESQSELPDPAPVPDSDHDTPRRSEAASVETAPLEESSDEEPVAPPKRVRKARVEPEPKVKAEPKAKAAPKRRGRPPGARNIVRAPASVVQQDPMEIIMTSMRERRQAHQERQHTFFQSFLPT